VQPPKRVSSL
jgi:hypothetical protein